MVFEHEVRACRETDKLIHELLGKVGEPPPYSTDKATAKALAKKVGLAVMPMFEPNYTHFFDSLGILPEEPPLGFLGLIEVEPTDEGDDLLLMHGWLSLSEGETFPLAVCRSLLVKAEIVRPSPALTPTPCRPVEA